MKFFLQSSRKFCFKLEIDGIILQSYNQFAKKFFENIVEIRLTGWFPSFSDIITSFKYLKHLRKLEIDSCFETYKNLPDNLTLSVTELILGDPGSYSFIHLPKRSMKVHCSILSFTPSLKELTVYCSSDTCLYYFSYHYEKEILKQLKNPNLIKKLKVLKWNVCLPHPFTTPSDDYVGDVLEIENLNLEKLEYSSSLCTTGKFVKFFNNQKNLKSLNLDIECISIDDHCINPFFITQIISTCLLNNLQDLTLYCCEDFKNLDNLNLEVFWKLKHLNLRNVKINTIFRYLTKHSEMKSLTLDYCEVDLPFDFNELQYLMNLNLFDLRTSEFPVKILLQPIFQHLLNLHELRLENYETDENDLFVSFFLIMLLH